MAERVVFLPPRRAGIIFHLAVILVLMAASGALFVLAGGANLGAAFLFFLLGGLFLAMPLPVFFYRLSALLRASYTLEREGLRIRWGMRSEDIPMPAIQWAEAVDKKSLALPPTRWPGSVLGLRPHPEHSFVEFVASQTRGLVLVGTAQRAYAISPSDPQAFLESLEAQIELGSLTPLRPLSSHPGFLAADIWNSPRARLLLALGAVLNLAVLIWVALAAPTRNTVSLGFTPSGGLLEPVPASQMFLLPVISLFFYLGNFALGSYFFRQPKSRPLAYVLWIGSALTAVLFLGAVNVVLINS